MSQSTGDASSAAHGRSEKMKETNRDKTGALVKLVAHTHKLTRIILNSS